MYYLYILKSLSDSGYYIGITEKIEKRIKEHNQGKTKSIKHRLPFVLIYSEEFETKTEARRREIAIKKNYQLRKEVLTKIELNLK